MAKDVRATKLPQFEESRWADRGFSQKYRDDADAYLPFRSQFIQAVKSFYAYFFSANPETSILDLGCGDGLFIQELLKSVSPAKIRLVDGSKEMLAAAKKRLGEQANIFFSQASFQEILTNDPFDENFDFIYSSLAIHHLPFEEKKKLYAYGYNHLSPGGCFVHYDVVAPPSEKLEKFYLAMWEQWITAHPATEKRKDLLEIPKKYKANKDNIPDTMESQLKALAEVGFNDVDCYFKYGIFSLFGGFK